MNLTAVKRPPYDASEEAVSDFHKVSAKLNEASNYYRDAQWLIEKQGFHSEVNVFAIKHTLMDALIMLNETLSRLGFQRRIELPKFGIERALFPKWYSRTHSKIRKCILNCETPKTKMCFVTVLERLLYTMRSIGFTDSELEQLYKAKQDANK